MISKIGKKDAWFLFENLSKFYGSGIFLTFMGDKPRWGELRLFGEFIYYTFIISFQ